MENFNGIFKILKNEPNLNFNYYTVNLFALLLKCIIVYLKFMFTNDMSPTYFSSILKRLGLG